MTAAATLAPQKVERGRGFIARRLRPKWGEYAQAMLWAVSQARLKRWTDLVELQLYVGHLMTEQLGRECWATTAGFDLETGLPLLRIRSEDWCEYQQLAEPFKCPRAAAFETPGAETKTSEAKGVEPKAEPAKAAAQLPPRHSAPAVTAGRKRIPS